MDARLLILAATFGLFIASLVVFVVVLARPRRPLPAPATQLPWNALPAAPVEEVDTSLAGLNVELSAESPSAALLTPLRAGQWIPPDEPAPAEQLQTVALDGRIAAFEPVPEIPEPAFASPQYESWEIGLDPAAVATPAVPQASATLPIQPSIPEVHAEVADAVVPAVATPPASVPVPAPIPEPISAPAPAPISEPMPAPVPEPVPAPIPEPMPAPLPAPAPIPMAIPEPEIVPAPTQEPAPALEQPPVAEVVLEPSPVAISSIEEPAVAPVWVPPSTPDATVVPEVPAAIEMPQPPIVPAAPPVSAAPVAEDDFSAEIAALLPSIADVERSVRPQAPVPVAVPVPDPLPVPIAVPTPAPIPTPVVSAPEPVPAVAPPSAASVYEPAQGPVPEQRPVAEPAPVREERPVAVVAPEQPATPVVPATPDPLVSRPSRPRAVVRAFDGADVVDVVQIPAARAAAPATSDERTQLGTDMVLAAPVEMWFGDARVGVKAGTPTYDRFRKYADVLLADLKASR